MSRAIVVRNGILSAVLWIGMSLPALAQGVGAIGGTVMDSSGAALPGATVTLSNPGTIGGSRMS